MKKVKQAKESERNQKSLAQKRSELLQDQPIIPNLANVESKLKTMFVSRDKHEEQMRLEAHRKRSAKPPGKVIIELIKTYFHYSFQYYCSQMLMH